MRKNHAPAARPASRCQIPPRSRRRHAGRCTVAPHRDDHARGPSDTRPRLGRHLPEVPAGTTRASPRRLALISSTTSGGRRSASSPAPTARQRRSACPGSGGHDGRRPRIRRHPRQPLPRRGLEGLRPSWWPSRAPRSLGACRALFRLLRRRLREKNRRKSRRRRKRGGALAAGRAALCSGRIQSVTSIRVMIGSSSAAPPPPGNPDPPGVSTASGAG